jgi:hypothetical protein
MSEELNEMSREQLVGEVLLVRSRLADAQARAERAEAILPNLVKELRRMAKTEGLVRVRSVLESAAAKAEALTPAPQGRTDGGREVCHTCLMPPTECKCIPLPTAEIDLKTGELVSDATAPEVKGGAA